MRRITDDVARIAAVRGRRQELLDDVVLLDHVKYRFVTAIEAAMDAAHHVCASEGFAAPSTNADAMRVLGSHGVLDVELAERMARAVGFRNMLVHRYADIDDHLVVEQLDELPTLDAFVRVLTTTFL